MSTTKKTKGPDRLPGDPTLEQLVERIVRVDHAGEYGAVRIYEGQMAIIGKTKAGPAIERMLNQEREHLSTFENLITDRGVRPTAFLPLWHVAGFAIGAATALMGEKAAMACTVAVEETIDEHYASQVKALTPYEEENKLLKTCAQFREEELEHRITGIEHGAEQTPGYDILSTAVKAGSRLAIWLSTRI